MSDGPVQPFKDMPQKKIPQLCKVCDQIGTKETRWVFRNAEDSEPSLNIYIHRPDLRSLKASALKGCEMCQFLLWTIEQSYDAIHVQTIDGDIVGNSEPSVRTKMRVSDRKNLLQKHSEELRLEILGRPPTELKNNPVAKQALNFLSEVCGPGRVILIGSHHAHMLPNALRAFVLYPFGASDIQDLQTPVITGLLFELATSLGIRILAPICWPYC